MDNQTTDNQDNSNPGNTNDENATLTLVKSKAMDALVPIIGGIQDIDPEKKFDICINAMRYTDNKNLAETALDAALKIADDGPKAEALVELINEIDYQLKSK